MRVKLAPLATTVFGAGCTVIAGGITLAPLLLLLDEEELLLEDDELLDELELLEDEELAPELLLLELEDWLVNSMVETLSAGKVITQLARLAATSPTKLGVVAVPSSR